MLIRALIVLLIALNLGAAAWWLTRTAPPPAAPPETPPGAVRLQLLNEAAPANAAATPAVPPLEAAPPATEPAPAPVVVPALTAAESPPPQCFSLGPFADTAAADAAIAKLGAQATRVRSREQPGRSASGYNVTPAARRRPRRRAGACAAHRRRRFRRLPDRQQRRTKQRHRPGPLPQPRQRRTREAALQAAGFPAQLQPIGEEGAAEWWLELAAAPGVAGAQLQTLAAATRFRALDCAALR